MAISTNIDGSSGGMGQLFDLLAVVSDPAAYKTKLAELQEAADRNQKYVELVAPAADILALRDKTRAEKDQAAKLLAEANKEANAILARARDDAARIVADAQSSSAAMVQDAEKTMREAKAVMASAEEKSAAAGKQAAAAQNAMAEAVAAANAATVAHRAADAAMENAVSLKNEVIQKHKAFIESLG